MWNWWLMHDGVLMFSLSIVVYSWIGFVGSELWNWNSSFIDIIQIWTWTIAIFVTILCWSWLKNTVKVANLSIWRNYWACAAWIVCLIELPLILMLLQINYVNILVFVLVNTLAISNISFWVHQIRHAACVFLFIN
jgi:hypothetical protein